MRRETMGAKLRTGTSERKRHHILDDRELANRSRERIMHLHKGIFLIWKWPFIRRQTVDFGFEPDEDTCPVCGKEIV